jgi:hypothetical protein
VKWRRTEARFILGAKAPATNRAYFSMWEDWRSFAVARGAAPLADAATNPDTLRLVREFVTDRGARGLRADRHLSAIRAVFLDCGKSDPTNTATNPRARAAAKGIRRSLARSTTLRKAAPVTVAILTAMQQLHRRRASPGGLAILAIAVCAFAGCLRLGAVIPESKSKFSQHRHWRRCDVVLEGNTATIALRSSKTEQEGTAAKIVFKATGNALCPVGLLKKLIEQHLDKGDSAPLFQRTNGDPVCKQDVTRAMQLAAAGAGLPAEQVLRLTGHSFRVGMVHAMLGAGFKYDHVQLYGRWKSEGAFSTYLRREFHELPQHAPGRAPDHRFPLAEVGL